MPATNPDPSGTVDITLDIRQLKLNIDEKNRPHSAVRKIWQLIAPGLLDKSIFAGQRLEIRTSIGILGILILEPRSVKVVKNDTRFNIIDIERNPEIRHACKRCSEEGKTTFGAFFCPECRKEGQPERLCEIHAHFLENKYTAYCQDHLPRCQCRQGCTDLASFECDYCHKFFSDKLKRHHPNDNLVLLCSNCFSYHFERCEDCEKEGRKRLGKSHCAFPVGLDGKRHDKRLCTFRHARQWQIWGPHWRGVVLCEQHYQLLSQASPTELIWMMVNAKAPAPFLRSKITDVYRVKNIVSYVNKRELPWTEMEKILILIEGKARQSDLPKFVRENIEQLLKNFSNAQANSVLEDKLLRITRDFYRPLIRTAPESAILSLGIKRVFGGQGKPQTYRIGIHVARDQSGRSMIGLLVGGGGKYATMLKDALKPYGVEGVDFEE